MTAPPRIVMALKVRDEEDVLADQLRFHLAQGVDAFVITDNDSRDRTPEILERYESAGLARVIQQSGDLLTEGDAWVTRMARIAATELEADWVVYGDADEFWWPLDGTLRDALVSMPDAYGVLVGARAEFITRPDGPEHWSERLLVRERRARLRPKVAHRASPNAVVLHEGGHDVAFVESGEDLRSALRPPGRPVLRGVRGEEDGSGGIDPVPAPVFGVRILHFPVRSLDQFRRRVEVAMESAPGRGARARLRDRYETEGIEGLYAELVLDEAQVEAGIREGELVEDTRVRDFLAHCPDPLAPGGGEGAPRPPELRSEELERERRELELDAMATLARHQRLNEVRLDASRERLRDIGARWNEMETTAKRQTAKARRRLERVKRLQEKVKRLRAELRRERRRPWSRLRNLTRRR